MFKQGDIVFVDLKSSEGHEQAGFRPVIIVSNDHYNEIMGLYIVCPISNNTKKFPTHIQLDERTKTTGSIFCEHVRTVDLSARKTGKKVEECPKDILKQVLKIIGISFEMDEDESTVLPKEEIH